MKNEASKIAAGRHVWSLAPGDVYQALSTSPRRGLSEEEAASRLKQFGFNELPEPPRRSLLLRLVDQLAHLMAILLWIAGILAFVAGMPELGVAIWAVIWINAGFSFWQEYKAEREMAELRQVMAIQAKAYRGGQIKVVSARELVPGDVIRIEEGDRISADARLVEAHQLRIDVSLLTGESVPVSRHEMQVSGDARRQGEISNLVFAGTMVTSGRGVGVVYATGRQSELGKIAHLTVAVKRERSTIELQVAGIVRTITILAVAMGVAVFLAGYFLTGMTLMVSILFAIGIIVANVPEGLLPTVTLAMAMGVRRMVRRNALVRRLSAVETLSAATVIMSDKTGTLTRNEMTVHALWIPSETASVTGAGYSPEGEVRMPASITGTRQLKLLLTASALCNNAALSPPTGGKPGKVLGDPTEGALLVASLKAGIYPDELRRMAPRAYEVPFDPHRRIMTVLVQWNLSEFWNTQSPYLVLTKGDPQEVLKRCRSLLENGRVRELTEEDRTKLMAAEDGLASQGYRMLGFAFREWNDDLAKLEAAKFEQGLTFIGMTAMMDPVRTEAGEAIARCRRAGIAVTMVTGDYGPTARAVAVRVGLATEKTPIVTGPEIEAMSTKELEDLISAKRELVFARVTPEQKLNLVQAYKALGHVVAVTGDGANDAPALRAANIGIAMGISGTDVAREAADIVLLDDNFATIVAAVEDGRTIYANIRKFMTYILTSNVPEIVPFIAMVALGIPPALTILQILAIDLGTDMLPALALGAEPPESGIMDQPPRPKNKPILDIALLTRSYGFLGIIQALAGMTAFFSVWWRHGYSLADLRMITPAVISGAADTATTAIYHEATALTLAAIVVTQAGNVFACRSENASVLRQSLRSNRLIWIGIGVELALIAAIVYFPSLQRVFRTASLSWTQWVPLLAWPALLLLAEEARKSVIRRRRRPSR